MYIVEALKNYGRVKAAYEVAREAALDFNHLTREIEKAPDKAVVIADGKYVLVPFSEFSRMIETDKMNQLSPEVAADTLVSMISSLSHIYGAVPKEVRAVSLAIEALGLTAPISDAADAVGVDLPEAGWVDTKLSEIRKLDKEDKK